MKCGVCTAKIPEGKMKCPACGKWIEHGEDTEIFALSQVDPSDLDRLVSGPWDLAWGGGIVTDSVSLFAGEAGCGKSTLLLQICHALAVQGKTTLYISREETMGRVKSRAVRLEIPDDVQERIKLVSRFSGSIRDVCEQVEPCLVIVDSLPALVGIGWSDVKEAVEVLMWIKDYADEKKCPAIVIDHINKKGEFSGPEAFAHLIDMTVFFRKDDEIKNLRRLIPEKNRDGDVDVQVCFMMGAKGLVYVEPPEENDEHDEDFDESAV